MFGIVTLHGDTDLGQPLAVIVLEPHHGRLLVIIIGDDGLSGGSLEGGLQGGAQCLVRFGGGLQDQSQMTVGLGVGSFEGDFQSCRVRV